MSSVININLSPDQKNLLKNIIAVSNRKLCTRPFEELIERVCCLQPKALILREKDLSEEEYTVLARKVLKICNEYNVLCILHSFPFAAADLGCRALHLPLHLLEQYQGNLSDFDIIGSSVHSPEEAVKAQDMGATYLTAGHVFETDCKKGLAPRGLDFLKETVNAVSVPVYGIGGIKIDKDQLDQLLSCGAAGGCVMSGMMNI